MFKKILAVSVVLTCFSVNADIEKLKPNSYPAFYEFVLNDEINKFIEGGYKGFLSQDVVTLQSAKLIADYNNNELAANKKYKDKPVRIKTVASSIGEDILGEGFITANGKNSYESTHLSLKNKNDEKILELSKGSKIDFICIGNGMALGSPVLKECDFTINYLNSFKSSALNSIKQIENKYYKPSSKFDARAIIAYKMFEKAIEVECAKSNKACTAAILKTVNDESFESGIDKKLATDLKALEEYAEKLPALPQPPKQSKLSSLFS